MKLRPGSAARGVAPEAPRTDPGLHVVPGGHYLEKDGLVLSAIEPAVPVTAKWIAVFAAAWLGVWMAQLAPIQLLLPLQVSERLPASSWTTTVVYFGLVSGIAGVFAVIAYPLAGLMSDRTTSRFGRRRPWIATGVVVFAAGLFTLSIQATLVGIVASWSFALVGFCICSAAMTAMISDQVPVRQRGRVSGWISVPQALGVVLGLALVAIVFTTQFMGYVVIASLLLVLCVPLLAVADDTIMTPEERDALPPLSLKTVLRSLTINPRKHPDFAWTLLSRVLVNLSNALGTGLLFYFFQFQLHVDDAEGFLLLTTAIYVFFTILASIIFGALSDHLQSRRVFVFISGLLVAASAIILIAAPSPAAAIGAGILLGLGQGGYFAVDQALATQVLPTAASRGKDLGIMNIALVVPQTFGPLIGALVVAWLGFDGLFALSGVTGLIGAVCIYKVRSVR